MVSKSFMSLDTSLLWSQEQLWKEVLCSSENSECNNEHTCLQAMNRRMSVWLSSTVHCDIWPQSSGTGNLLNVVIHINEFAYCEAGWIALFQVFALITRMFLCTFFLLLLVILILLVLSCTLCSLLSRESCYGFMYSLLHCWAWGMREERKLYPLSTLFFFLQFQPAITTARTNKSIICLKLLKHLAEWEKTIKRQGISNEV